MIERVLLDGVDVELEDVLAAVTIRHGRGSVDDGPMASTATAQLVNITQDRIAAFTAGSTLELLLAGDVPRFRGRITDATTGEDGLSILAVSSMSWLSRRIVGGSDWPLESWRDRVLRVFQDAGILLTWAESPASSWSTAAGDWVDLTTASRLTLDTLDNGPQIAARVGSTETLGGYLGGEFRESEPAVAANLPDGTVLVQQLSKRASKTKIELDPDVVAYPPEWSQTDDVENVLDLEYDDGSGTSPSVHAENASSINTFERRENDITTALAVVAAANSLAALRVNRRGFPRWNASSVDVLELEPAISIGTPVHLHELPDWAPASAYLGIVEGWEDHLEPNDAGELVWTMRLFLSDPRLSGGFGSLWYSTDELWNQTGTVKWNTADLLA